MVYEYNLRTFHPLAVVAVAVARARTWMKKRIPPSSRVSIVVSVIS